MLTCSRLRWLRQFVACLSLSCNTLTQAAPLPSARIPVRFSVLKQLGTHIHWIQFQQAGDSFAKVSEVVLLNLATNGLDSHLLTNASLSPRGTWLAVSTSNQADYNTRRKQALQRHIPYHTKEFDHFVGEVVQTLTIFAMRDLHVVYQLHDPQERYGTWFVWRSDRQLVYMHTVHDHRHNGSWPEAGFLLTGPRWQDPARRLPLTHSRTEILLTPAEIHQQRVAANRLNAYLEKPGFNPDFTPLTIEGGSALFDEFYFEDTSSGAVSPDGKAIAFQAVDSTNIVRLCLVQARKHWKRETVPIDMQQRDIEKIWFWKDWLVIKDWRRGPIVVQGIGAVGTYAPGTQQIRVFRLDNLHQSFEVAADLFLGDGSH